MNTFLRKGIALTLVACSIFTNTSLGNLKPFKPTVVKASEIKNDKKVQKSDKKEIKVLPNDENVETKEGKQLLIKDEKNGEILGNFKKAYDVKYQGSTYILEYKNEKTAKKDEKEFTKEKRNVEINETFDVNSKEKTISDETKDENDIQVSEENDKKEEKQQIIVAVIDSGVDLSNEKLNTRLAKSSKENFVKLSDEDIQNKFYSDELGHGTKIAKLIAENTDSNVSILPIKVTDDKNQTNTLKLYNGIKSAIDSNVDVINISLNGKGKSKLIDNAIKEATEKGIAVVVSAGNDGEDTKEYIPSSTKEAIVVSSKDTNMSNYGDEIDYCAEDSYVGEKGSVSVGTSYSAAYVTASVAKVLEKTT
ncbi:Serine protease, subtilisin family, partial [Lachnospiraceae bacterium C7]